MIFGLVSVIFKGRRESGQGENQRTEEGKMKGWSQELDPASAVANNFFELRLQQIIFLGYGSGFGNLGQWSAS